MKIIKNIFRDLYLYILWALMAILLIGFIFTKVTDTTPKKKVTIFVDAEFDSLPLRVRLEEQKPQGIRMIKIHPFSYILFDGGELEEADFYIMTENAIAEYEGKFLELDGFAAKHPEYEYLERNGKKVGILIYKPGEAGGAAEYIHYNNEKYYVMFNDLSRHIASLKGSGDDAALQVFENLINIK